MSVIVLKDDVKKVNPLISLVGDGSDALKTIANRWELIEKIGHGGFGEIHKAFDKVTREYVAIKIEKKIDSGSLQKESGFYKYIADYSFKYRIPNYTPTHIWFGKEENVGAAVFDLMGPSLSVLFRKCGKRFSLKSILMLADQMTDCIRFIHQCGIIHRDIKPGNFVIGGRGCENKVYIIDFGLSDFYRDKTGKHIPYKTNCTFKGTYRYASKNSHFKIEQSRRDDLESLGYILIYFLKGKLPWQSLKVNKNDRKRAIGKHKESITIEKLTENLPEEFYIFMKYVRNLSFHDEPNYDWIKNLFQSCLFRHNMVYDYIFDWNLPLKNNNPVRDVSKDLFLPYGSFIDDSFLSNTMQMNNVYNDNNTIVLNSSNNTIINEDTIFNDLLSEKNQQMSSSPINFSSPYTTQTTLLEDEDELSLLGMNFYNWENYDSPIFNTNNTTKVEDNAINMKDTAALFEEMLGYIENDIINEYQHINFFNMVDDIFTTMNDVNQDMECQNTFKRKICPISSCLNENEELPRKRIPPPYLKVKNN